MRFIYFLLITLIFTACGHHKIRFSKVEKKQKVVEISEIPNLKKSSETAYIPRENTVQSEENVVSTETNTSDQTIEENQTYSFEESQVDLPETVEDSTTITTQEAEIAKEEALWAQKRGARSLTFSIIAPVLFILAGIALIFALYGPNPLAAILVIALMVAGLVSLILGMVFGISSLRAKYNTPKGRKFAIAGVIISSVFVALLLLNFAIGFF